MNASKKCPHCGQWSRWTQNPADRCEHCQSILDPVAVARQQARQERKEEEEQRFSMRFLRFFKRIGLGFQIAFVSIISFFLWLIALLAG
jgi:methionyl-tRNA synthetase